MTLETEIPVQSQQEQTARRKVTVDGNEAAAYVAYRASEVVAIYPITPSSTMAELADAWAAAGEKNIWGSVPLVQEMQSEGGAAGAVHGALQSGALTTTFTASQGLFLMIPDMYKIAGELTSAVFHITARTIATHALSIFGDHSDVMACRGAGWGMLFSNSVQEAHDFALIATAATLRTRIPFLHMFDGFRTSHEVGKIEQLSDADIRSMIDEDLVRAHRARALSPEKPVLRGTAQNPDVFFQGRERINSYYDRAAGVVEEAMECFAGQTGRRYHLFDYEGAPDAERVIVLMGSGAETAHETVDFLKARGEKVGLLKVRLYRPFSPEHFVQALPQTVKQLAVLDRTKEPGADGEPLYKDVATALFELRPGIKVIAGRYGLSSKEFTPAMVKAVFDEMLRPQPKKRFSVGIRDDVTNLSLDYDSSFLIEPADVVRAMFYGLGADGTVGANKNSIKIIGEDTDNYAQGYFVYDSKKSGSVTVSHLRFGPRPIRSTYLIQKPTFVAVHQFGFLERYPVLDSAADGATILLNSPYSAAEVWDHLPQRVRNQIVEKKLEVYVLDGYGVAKATGMGGRMNTIMQTGFFALSGVLPREEAVERIKVAIKKTYGKLGETVVKKNYAAVDAALDHLAKATIPADATVVAEQPVCDAKAQDEDPYRACVMEMMAGRGDDLPVSVMPLDGTFPTGTARWEKRNIALEVPVWDSATCIQCGKCTLVCPHACIRSKVVAPDTLKDAPPTLKSTPARWKELPNSSFLLQVAVEDCTGCALCVEACPAKNKSAVGLKAINMAEQLPLREQERANWDFFLGLPEVSRVDGIKFNNVKNVQLLQPLFEFSGACGGCGETPYLKLVSQLFGDRTVVANATGCSSIYGGNLPTTPWTKNPAGRGPAWANSLFEDNAEFGMGMRLAISHHQRFAAQLVESLRDRIGAELADGLLHADQSDEAGIVAQRARVASLKTLLESATDAEARNLLNVADVLVKRTVWIIGGDGWAYDIGYGGLDHVLAQGHNVNVLVLDTEVYSNTGGQMSKSTARGAVAKFAAGGKAQGKKDLGRMAMSYGNVYVAQVAMGANDAQTVKALIEAESYDGPSIVIAYSHCIAHGIDMSKGLSQQKLAVDSGHWILYRYDPRLAAQGKNPLQIDSKEPSLPLSDYLYSETRYRMLKQSNPAAAEKLLHEAQHDVAQHWKAYQDMAAASAEKGGA